MADPTVPTLSSAAQKLYANKRDTIARNVAIATANLTPDKYEVFNSISAKYPGISKDLVMSMVQQGLNADTPGINKIVSLDGISQLKADTKNVEDIKASVKADRGILGNVSNAWKELIYDPIKGASRVTFAALRLPYDMLTTLGRNTVAAARGEDISRAQIFKDATGIASESTYFGSLLRNWSDQGSGFFITQETGAGKAQAEAMSKYGKIFGQSYTLGRGFGSIIANGPESTTYKVLSGIVDASLNLALDPSLYFGPGGIAKIARGGEKLKAAKEAAKPFSETALLDESKRLTKEQLKDAKKLKKEAEKVRGRTADRFLKETQEFQELEKVKIDTLAGKTKKLLATETDALGNLATDATAQATLSTDNITKFFITHPGTQSGDLVKGIDRLAADYKNTGNFFDGYIMLDEVPTPGNISVGAHELDEYFVTAIGDEPLKLLDLADDFSKATPKVKQAEAARRAMLLDAIDGHAADFTKSPSTREVFDQIARAIKSDSAEAGGPVGALYFSEGAETMGSLIARFLDSKNPQAMSILNDEIMRIWQVDGFSNIRSIIGDTGGVVIANGKRIAASKAQIAVAAAEIADPTNLGPNVAKLMESIKPTDQALKEAEERVANIAADQIDLEQRIKDVQIFRQYADQDPELLAKIANDPEYAGLDKLIQLNTRMADRDILLSDRELLKEYYYARLGITDNFGGQVTGDVKTALKYLLGRRFQEIAKVVADETDTVKIHNFFGQKLDADLVTALTAAKTPDDVYRVFLGHLGAEATDPNIFRSASLRVRAGQMTANPLARLTDPVSLVPLRFAETIERSFNSYFVRSTSLSLSDTSRLVNGFADWVKSSQLKGIIGKAGQNDIIERTQRALFNATSNQERAAIIEKATVEIMDRVAVKAGLDAAERKTLESVLKVGSREKNEITAYSIGRIGDNSVPEVILPGMDVPVKLPGAIHEFQLLQDTIFLPDTKEILKTFNKFQVNRVYGRAKAGRVFAEEMGDIWRTAQLVFRISYIWRNIAEMQMRQFFSGHASMFSHPMQFAAMVMANPATRRGRFAQRMARYQTDLEGNIFKNAEAEGEFLEAVRLYQVYAHRMVSVSDYTKNGSSEIYKYYRVIDSTDEEFFKGLAYTINRFASDKLNPEIARLVISGDEVAKRAYVDDLIKNFDEQDNIIRDYTVGAFERNEGIRTIFLRDPSLPPTKDNLSPEKIFAFFFDEAQEHTLAGQIKTLAGNGPKSYLIMDLIASGEKGITFTNDAGKLVKIVPPWRRGIKSEKELASEEKAFMEVLERNFSAEDLAGARVLMGRTSAAGMPPAKELTKWVDRFFEYSARLESKYNFGPEYTMSYWDFVGRYASMLSTKDLKYVQKRAQENLAPIRKGSKIVGPKHSTLRVIDSELKRRLKNPSYVHKGGAEWQTIHQMAAREAAEYTKNLFYDASRQRQWAQSARLIAPFAQAQANTIIKWNKLWLGNPVPLYKFGKAFDALNKEGSNVIYDVTNMTYDDSQGFFYKEEGSDKKKFKIPLAGSIIGAFAGQNIDTAQGLQITAPVQSLNLAFGQVNPLVPGIGPAGQLLFTMSGKSQAFGPLYQTMRDIITPFGDPQSVEDIVFPAWLKKTVLYAVGNDKAIQRDMKDWAGYLASTGKYGDNPFANDAERTRLFNDAESLSKWAGFATALFQSISPATPSTEILSKIKDPNNKMNFMTNTMLYANWQKFVEKYPGEYGKAIVAFADTYGANNLLIAVGGSSSAVRGTDDAWTWLNNNPTAADKYARNPGDVVPFFFPGGNYSLKYYNWQRSSGARRVLSTQEIANEAENMVYSMAKDRIEEEQIANNYPNFWYVKKIAELDKQFGARPPDTVVTQTAGEKISRIGEALEDPAFKQSPVYQEISEFYPMYKEFQELLNKGKVSNYAELSGKGGYATILRNNLVAKAQELMERNPAFTRMYYGVFSGQLEG